MKNLISMTDFVLEQELKLRNDFNYTNKEALVEIFNYANFLKQPLELGMFVPCDEDGNVLEEPESLKGFYETDNEGMKQEAILRQKYQQAKERCLFEIYSFEEECDDFWYFSIDELTLIGIDKAGTIEDLVKYNLTLTQTAIKQIGV